MLHDIGKIVLEQYFREEFKEIIVYADEHKVHSAVAEEAVLGANHAQIGAWLAKKWHLPALFVNGILYHHKTTSAPNEYIDAVVMTNVADYVCLKGNIGYSGSDVLPVFDSKVWKHLGLTNGQFVGNP